MPPRSQQLVLVASSVVLTLTALAMPAGASAVHTQPDTVGRTLQAAVTGAAPEAGAFTAVAPSRLLDTRGGAKVTGKSSVLFQVAGMGGVPDAAGAVVLNVTATGPAAGGFVTAYPAGANRPSASNLNFAAGQTIANHVTVKLGADGSAQGKVALYNGSGGPVHLFADVAGWYAAGDGQAPGTFTAVTPHRLLDTRTGTKPAANSTTPFQVTGESGIPSGGVGAGVFNVTATNPAKGGYLTAHPNAEDRPDASNLNFRAGQTIPNAATIKLGADGKVALFNGSAGTINLLADVAGYFTSGVAAVPGAFTPVTPTRLLDTRPGTQVPAKGSVTVTMGQPTAGAAVLNVTATNTGGPGFITAHPAGANRPDASNLNFVAGQTIPNLVTVKLSDAGEATFYNGSTKPVDLLVDLAGWYLAPPPVVTTEGPNGGATSVCSGTNRRVPYGNGSYEQPLAGVHLTVSPTTSTVIPFQANPVGVELDYSGNDNPNTPPFQIVTITNDGPQDLTNFGMGVSACQLDRDQPDHWGNFSGAFSPGDPVPYPGISLTNPCLGRIDAGSSCQYPVIMTDPTRRGGTNLPGWLGITARVAGTNQNDYIAYFEIGASSTSRGHWSFEGIYTNDTTPIARRKVVSTYRVTNVGDIPAAPVWAVSGEGAWTVTPRASWNYIVGEDGVDKCPNVSVEAGTTPPVVNGTVLPGRSCVFQLVFCTQRTGLHEGQLYGRAAFPNEYATDGRVDLRYNNVGAATPDPDDWDC